MIGTNMYTTVITLHKQGLSERSIARATSIHRDTIRKIIKKYNEEQVEHPTPFVRASKLDGWKSQIADLLSKNLTKRRVWEELHSQGCNASYPMMVKYINKNMEDTKTCIRFFTKPGEEAQVDFGDIGLQYDQYGKRRKGLVFNMRLSYSRLDYYEVVFDQKVNTWLQCHINAFNYFGGITQVIKLDNLKSGIVNANFYEPEYQQEYKNMADYYGTLITPCRTYQPQEKGKVESGIKYVKNNFFLGRKFRDNRDLNQQLSQWLDKANNRIHGTTHKQPIEVFKSEEKQSLVSPPKVLNTR